MASLNRSDRPGGAKKVRSPFQSTLAKFAAAPHIAWSVLFIVAPLLFVVYFAFTNVNGEFTFENISMLSTYSKTFILSLLFSLIATVICILIGYPLAYFIARLSPKRQRLLVTMVMIPMWISLLIRTYSLMALLDNGGIVSLCFEKLIPLEDVATKFDCDKILVRNFVRLVLHRLLFG